MSIPYTYHIYHRPTGMRYYGVQHGKNAHPSNLWVTYFTSSKLVKKLREEYGDHSFSVEIRKIFNTREDAVYWEQRVLRKLNVLQKQEIWLNRHIGGDRFVNNKPHTPESNEKNRKAHLGRKLPPRSEVWRQNISRAKMGARNPMYGEKYVVSEKRKIALQEAAKNMSLETKQMRSQKMWLSRKANKDNYVRSIDRRLSRIPPYLMKRYVSLIVRQIESIDLDSINST